jgi:hypothetical protein
VTNVKSGWAGDMTEASSSSWATAGAAPDKRPTRATIRIAFREWLLNMLSSRMQAGLKTRLYGCRFRLIVRSADFDPAPDDSNLAVGKVRTAIRHPFVDEAWAACQFLGQKAVFGVARNDANCAWLASGWYIYQRTVGHSGGEV